MKFNIRIVLHLGIQEPFTLCQVHRVTIFIQSRILLFETQKIFQLFFIFTPGIPMVLRPLSKLLIGVFSWGRGLL